MMTKWAVFVLNWMSLFYALRNLSSQMFMIIPQHIIFLTFQPHQTNSKHNQIIMKNMPVIPAKTLIEIVCCFWDDETLLRMIAMMAAERHFRLFTGDSRKFYVQNQKSKRLLTFCCFQNLPLFLNARANWSITLQTVWNGSVEFLETWPLQKLNGLVGYYFIDFSDIQFRLPKRCPTNSW